jgi:hypothetical protein
MQPFALEALGGLYTFQLEQTWYCFTVSIARVLSVTTRAVAQSVSRHFSAADAEAVLVATRSSHAAAFPRLLSTYAAVKRLADGTVESLNARKGDKFSLYSMPLVAKLLALHSPAKVDADTLETVRQFVSKNAGEVKVAMAAARLLLPPLAAPQEVKVKLEPASPRSLPASSSVRGIPVIDLTNAATLAALAGLEDDDAAAASDVEQTLSSLVDNFALWHPVSEEYAVLREYSLRPAEVSESVLLQEQCQRFSEYRQEIWNWHRDPSQVTARTVGNNIRVFLLFGGFVCHSAKRHRLKPAAFDMRVFGSQHIEAYVMDFLQVRPFVCCSSGANMTRAFCVCSTCTARVACCLAPLPTT